MIKELLPCGTPAAALRHKRAGEAPCNACRQAQRDYVREKQRVRRLANPEAERARGRAWRARDIEKSRAKDRADWHKLSPETKYARRRKRQLKVYGITWSEYDILLAEQNHRCGACGTTEPGRKGWCIDHDHSATSDAFRGILCMICNVLLGMMGDDLSGVIKYEWAMGVRYLEQVVPQTRERLRQLRLNPAPQNGAGDGAA